MARCASIEPAETKVLLEAWAGENVEVTSNRRGTTQTPGTLPMERF
jgi:hypothetical protein